MSEDRAEGTHAGGAQAGGTETGGTQAGGRRGRKKARTRKALSDAAMALFFERGYDAVTLKEVAEAADVAPSTLYTHFPTKESLVFDIDEDTEAQLVGVVTDRPAGLSVLEALRENFRLTRLNRAEKGIDVFQRLIDSSPALRSYARDMWQRHEDSLAEAIAGECNWELGDVRATSLARFVLSIPDLAEHADDPQAALDTAFDLLDSGWRSFSAVAQ